MEFQKLSTPPSQVSASEILIEALEEVQPRGISQVIVLCFDEKGTPLGWLSNVGNAIQRFGLIEIMKNTMLSDSEDA